MKITDQVCTVDQAIELLDLGVRDITQSFRFKWTKHERLPNGGVAYNTRDWHLVPSDYLDGFGHQDSIRAFTTAELGLMCKDCISGPAFDSLDKFYATTDEYHRYDIDAAIGNIVPLPDPLPSYQEAPSQAQALAKLLIWLITSRLLSVDEVNKRLSYGN